jgi:hypothetical protein
MATLSPPALISIAILLAALATDTWVLHDARTRQRQGNRVTVRIGNLQVETPEAWFLACVALWPIALPLYLTASGRNPFARSQ